MPEFGSVFLSSALIILDWQFGQMSPESDPALTEFWQNCTCFKDLSANYGLFFRAQFRPSMTNNGTIP